LHQVRNRDGELKKLKRSFDLINGVGVGVRDGVLLRSGFGSRGLKCPARAWRNEPTCQRLSVNGTIPITVPVPTE
jgi:hypothetical protein